MKSGLRRLMNQGTPAPVPYAAPGRSVLAMFNGQSSNETYMRAYGTSGTIFSIVTILATSVATPAWHLYRSQPQDGRRRYTTTDKGSDQRVEVVNHAALSLWNHPNDFSITSEFITASQQHLELTGECWWVMDKSGPGNFPTSMWLVRPDRMEPVPGSGSQFLLGYVYNAPDGTKIPLDVDDVIFTKFPNPLDPYRGLGPAQSVLVNVDAMRYANEFNRNFFLNDATPGGIIQMDHRVSDQEWDELSNRWRESHQGVSRAHRVAVLENGSTWVPTGITNKDMEFATLIETERDVIREAWGIHKTMLGNSDDVNRANAQTAEEVFGSWKIIPRLNMLRDALNHRLLPMFGSTGAGVEFDYENPLPDDREADNAELTIKANAAAALITAGFEPEDVLEAVGLPAMDVAEKATQQPALPPGWVASPPAAPAPENPAKTPSEPSSSIDQEVQNLVESLKLGLRPRINGKELANGSH